MQIATWNLMRPSGRRLARLADEMRPIRADVWVLTETVESFSPGDGYGCLTSGKPDRPHRVGEKWVAIWSRLPILGGVATSDPARAACVRLQTPNGAGLVVYGSVLPWLGSAWQGYPAAGGAAYQAALAAQKADWVRLRREYPDHELVVAGDFNQDLRARHYYGSARGKCGLRQALCEAGVHCVTALEADPVDQSTGGKHACIDHLCVTTTLRDRLLPPVRCWPSATARGPRLTDHFGVAASFRD